MPRTWDRSELQPRRTTTAESARLARYAARLLAATASAIAISTMVANGTSAALLDPARDGVGLPPQSTERSKGGDAAPATPDRPGTGSSAAADDSTEPYIANPPTQESEQAPDEPLASSATDEPPALAGDADVIKLTDDDRELPLFRAAPLAPGGRTVRCITLTYAGARGAGDVRMRVEATGPLSAWLMLTVDVAEATDPDCTGPGPWRRVEQGSLQALSELPASAAVQRATPGVPFSLRITTELPSGVPQEAAGATAAGRFVWSVG